MRVLQLLASKPGQVFSQAQIEKAIWVDVIVTTNSVYQSITQLRRALGDERENPRYVETIPRRGYRLICSVRPVCELTPTSPESVLRIRLNSGARGKYVWIGIGVGLIAIALVYRANLLDWYGAGSNTASRHDAANTIPITLGELPAATNMQPSLLRELAEVAWAQGRPREARGYIERALQIQNASSDDTHPFFALLLSDLAFAYIWEGNFIEAEAAARRALKALEATPDGHPNKIEALTHLGYALLERGVLDESERHLSRALHLATQTFGERSRTRSELLTMLGALRHSQARFAEAEEFALEAVRVSEQVGMDAHSRGHAKTGLLITYLAQARYEEARALAEEILTLFTGLRTDHPHVLAARDLLGKALIGLEQYAQAESIFRENIVLWLRNDGWSMRAAGSASALGEALLGQRRIEEASEYLTRASLQIDHSPSFREDKLRHAEHQRRLEKLRALRSMSADIGHDAAKLKASDALL